MVVPSQIARTQSQSGWCIALWRVLKGLTLRCMTSKENRYSLSHSPCLNTFKFSRTEHLLTRNAISFFVLMGIIGLTSAPWRQAMLICTGMLSRVKRHRTIGSLSQSISHHSGHYQLHADVVV
jgi:hypothetical protein